MKTSELSGALLNYWVARAEGLDVYIKGDYCFTRSPNESRHFCENWDEGGPLIERERIATCPFDGADRCDQWIAHVGIVQNTAHFGEAALVAAMRAYVASKFGAEVPDDHEAAQPTAEPKV